MNWEIVGILALCGLSFFVGYITRFVQLDVTDAMVSAALDAYTEECPPAYHMAYVPALRAAIEAALLEAALNSEGGKGRA